MAELKQEGLPVKEAARAAIESFGRARVVARLSYEAYSKGSWADAVMACLPHLIIAGLFATHLWRHPLLAPIAFALIVCVTLFGWWRGKPNWLYGWLGYSLLPLLIIGYTLRFIPGQAISFFLRGEGSIMPSAWSLAIVISLYLLSLWLIVLVTISSGKKGLAPGIGNAGAIADCWLLAFQC